ncbi:MAG: L-threonine 3-dehydrogenase [Phycisphaerales bacterium]|nr:MAG: L-threonine 3-dehydrogenase [Phycisphaerales bacterium]
MKALIKESPRPGLWLDDVPEPDVGPNDVLIKIRKTSICGTDLHIYNWDEWAQKTIRTPIVIGHEFVGSVERFGRNVHDVELGELVSGEGHVVCGRCRNCLAGRRHLCKDPSCIGVDRNGAFAEYLGIPVSNIWHCDPKISPEVLSCFDPLGNATHTTLSFDLVGEDVLITGAGPIGSMAIAVAKHAGARHVVVTDVNPYRLELAKKMGATMAIDVRTDKIHDAFDHLGMKEGFDVGLEMSGSPDAFKSMLENMCHGGKIAMLGILPHTAIDWDRVVFNGLTIKGIYGREMFETWYKMTMLIQKGLDITPLITHRFPAEEFEKGFEVMRSGNSGKVILDWTPQ